MNDAHPLHGTRSAGVLLHPTSLPGGHGVGDLGPEAHRFLEWAASAGFSWWQMLPVGPVGAGHSPYASASSFAGEELLVSLDHLAEERLLAPSDRRAPKSLSSSRVDFGTARAFKRSRLLIARDRFARSGGFSSRAFQSFERQNRPWLGDWLGWRGSDPHGLDAFIQFRFAEDWARLREAARAHGLRLIGDVPIFVDLQSADVAAHPELFRLNRRGLPTVVTGVPPDCFSATGQRWGHPHFHWPEHRRTKFSWWRARVAHALERFDLVRIDHFIGFHHAYEIPASSPDATRGAWKRQAGAELLAALRRDRGSLPFIAEDLGALTPAVTALRDRFNLPGMRILQHAFWSGESGDLPHNHPRHSVVYTGTHDNDTTASWWRGLGAAERVRVRALGGAGSASQVLARMLMGSPAALAVIPMQDILGLGAAARMNLPGASSGQWSWRMRAVPPRQLAQQWRALLESAGRTPRRD